jgi:hypothetical protein
MYTLYCNRMNLPLLTTCDRLIIRLLYEPSIHHKSDRALSFDRTLKITKIIYEIRDNECPIGLNARSNLLLILGTKDLIAI